MATGEAMQQDGQNPASANIVILDNGRDVVRVVRAVTEAIFVPIPGDGTVRHILPAEAFEQTSRAVAASEQDHASAFFARYGALVVKGE